LDAGLLDDDVSDLSPMGNRPALGKVYSKFTPGQNGSERLGDNNPFARGFAQLARLNEMPNSNLVLEAS
jgi:hypothetical protein